MKSLYDAVCIKATKVANDDIQRDLKQKKDGFIARVKEWPDVVVEKPTREEAVEQVKARLVEYLTQQVEIIPIDIDLPADNGNPWLKNFGRFASDPTFDDLQAEIAAYRQAIDKE